MKQKTPTLLSVGCSQVKQVEIEGEASWQIFSEYPLQLQLFLFSNVIFKVTCVKNLCKIKDTKNKVKKTGA